MTKVAIVGTGLVGSLCGSMLLSHGYSVTIFESRPDPRVEAAAPSTSAHRARSINLALSPRGIEAIRSVSSELLEAVLREGTEMRGRMVHHLSAVEAGKAGVKEGQDYGRYEEEGECIRSIDRGLLSRMLVEHVSDKGVEIRFNRALKSMDLRRKEGVKLVFSVRGGADEVWDGDWVIGADGARSVVRSELARQTRLDYGQYFARHSYVELSIPPAKDGSWVIEREYLHLWPRGEVLLIALPNRDKSFTSTLFAPLETLQSYESTEPGVEPIVQLFKDKFPDALAVMGEENLLRSWRENPKEGLVTITADPYHFEDRVLLIGDAAHAMVPFYGQGMNCAFEDVRVLHVLLSRLGSSPMSSTALSPLPLTSSSLALSSNQPFSTRRQVLEAYSSVRKSSIAAIQALAHSNYEEMASKVLDPLYLFRLGLDRLLSNYRVRLGALGLGGGRGEWESLYRMVTFRWTLGYEEAIRRRARQTVIIEWSLGVLGVGTIAAAAVGLRAALTASRR